MVRDQGRGERKVKSSHKDKTLVSSIQFISLPLLFPMGAMSRWHDFEVQPGLPTSHCLLPPHPDFRLRGPLVKAAIGAALLVLTIWGFLDRGASPPAELR